LLMQFSKVAPNTRDFKHINEMHNFIQSPIEIGKERSIHKTQNPLKICLLFIEVNSNEGDLIHDPFMVYGSMAVACKMLKKELYWI